MTTTETNEAKADPNQPLLVTPEALEVVLETRAMEDEPSETALKVAITGSSMTDFTYSLELAPLSEATKTDLVYKQGSNDELSVIIPQDSTLNILGSTLDVAASSNGGLVIRNPNPPDPLVGLDLDLQGDLADKAKTVLEEVINPALASHGGFATLLGVEETKLFVTMGGGCQGCAASAATLRDGIKSMLMKALPEITDVVDATDHSAGENPFYT